MCSGTPTIVNEDDISELTENSNRQIQIQIDK